MGGRTGQRPAARVAKAWTTRGHHWPTVEQVRAELLESAMFDFDDGATLVVDAEADIDLDFERPFRALPDEENVIRGRGRRAR